MAQNNKTRKDDTKTKANDMPRYIQALALTDGGFYSPIDLKMSSMQRLELNTLGWYNYDLPAKKMKITNSGHTVILSGKWNAERPFVRDGPLSGTYVFSQLHFHWGETDREGSEHTVGGKSFPLEMHVVHFKSCYMTQDMALKERDGLTIMVYLFKIQSSPNPNLEELVNTIQLVKKPHTSAKISPIPMSKLVHTFERDYFLYWGSVMTTSTHFILWFVCREPIGISVNQMAQFRTIKDVNNDPLLHTYRDTQPLNNRSVFHVSPRNSTNNAILAIPSISGPEISYYTDDGSFTSNDGKTIGTSYNGPTNTTIMTKEENHLYHLKRLKSNSNLVPQIFKSLFPVRKNSSATSIVKSVTSKNTIDKLVTINEANSNERNEDEKIDPNDTDIYGKKSKKLQQTPSTDKMKIRNSKPQEIHRKSSAGSGLDKKLKHSMKPSTSYCLETIYTKKDTNDGNETQKFQPKKEAQNDTLPTKELQSQNKIQLNVSKKDKQMRHPDHAQVQSSNIRCEPHKDPMYCQAKEKYIMDTFEKLRQDESNRTQIPEKLPASTSHKTRRNTKQETKNSTQKPHFNTFSHNHANNKSDDDEMSSSIPSPSLSEDTNCESCEECKVDTVSTSISQLSSFTATEKYGNNPIRASASNYVSLCDLLILSKTKPAGEQAKPSPSTRPRQSKIDKMENTKGNSNNTSVRPSTKYTSLKDSLSKVVMSRTHMKVPTSVEDCTSEGSSTSITTIGSTRKTSMPKKYSHESYTSTGMSTEPDNTNQPIQYIAPLMYNGNVAFVTPVMISKPMTENNRKIKLDIKRTTMSTVQFAKESYKTRKTASTKRVCSVSTQYSDPFLRAHHNVIIIKPRALTDQTKPAKELKRELDRQYEMRTKHIQTCKTSLCNDSYLGGSSTEDELDQSTSHHKFNNSSNKKSNKPEKIHTDLVRPAKERTKMREMTPTKLSNNQRTEFVSGDCKGTTNAESNTEFLKRVSNLSQSHAKWPHGTTKGDAQAPSNTKPKKVR